MDYLYLLILIAFAFSLVTQARVSLTFAKYKKVKSKSGLTGAMIAQKMLVVNGILGTRVEQTEGKLSDHFDPEGQVVRLSKEVYAGDSVSAIGVAAHEVGHAIQHKQGYLPIRIREAIYPAVAFGSNAAIPLFLLGMLTSIQPLVLSGIVLFFFVALFQLVTLPLEFDASRRALKELEANQFLQKDEIAMARTVLSAAALTYLAAITMTILQFLRLIALASRKR